MEFCLFEKVQSWKSRSCSPLRINKNQADLNINENIREFRFFFIVLQIKTMEGICACVCEGREITGAYSSQRFGSKGVCLPQFSIWKITRMEGHVLCDE